MTISDGNVTFQGGQNDRTDRSEVLESQVLESQYRRGINVTTREGRLGPRPGFSLREFRVVTEGGIGKRLYSEIVQNGKFQGAISYDAEDGQFILAVFCGIIFRFDKRNLTAEVIPIGEDDDRMDQYRRRIPASHAGRFVIFYDYPNENVILENRTARRASRTRESLPGVPQPELPTSVLGAYVNNRLWIANEQNDYIASDPVGYRFPDAPITFEEVLGIASPYPNQAFSLGSQSKHQPITFLGFLQVPDTATGIGPLVIGTKNSVYAARADEPRINWESIPFDRLVLFNAGPSGPRAGVNTNTDLLMHCSDNQIRSLFLGRQEQQRWSNAPMSKEVSPWLEEHDVRELRDLAFASYFKNRAFFSVGPYRVTAYDLNNKPVNDYAHGGLIVLELDNVSGLGKSANPAWSGLWTGISPMEMVILEDGPYIFSKDDEGVNRIYFMDENLTYDEFEGAPKNIVSRIYTRAYDGRNPFIDKELGQVSYALTGVEGQLDFLAEYRPAHSRVFSLWKDFKHEAETEICDAKGGEIPMLSPHDFRDLNFGDPEEVNCDMLTEDQQKLLRKMELRLTISARNWSLEGIHVMFEELQQNARPTVPNCGNFTEKRVLDECEESDWQLYRTAPRSPGWA